MRPRLANEATGRGSDLMTSKLTIRAELENDCCQPNVRVFNSIEILRELGLYACPYLVKNDSEHSQVGLEHWTGQQAR